MLGKPHVSLGLEFTNLQLYNLQILISSTFTVFLVVHY